MAPYLVLLLCLTVEMIPDEQEQDKTSETEDKSRDGEDKGKEHLLAGAISPSRAGQAGKHVQSHVARLEKIQVRAFIF